MTEILVKGNDLAAWVFGASERASAGELDQASLMTTKEGTILCDLSTASRKLLGLYSALDKEARAAHHTALAEGDEAHDAFDRTSVPIFQHAMGGLSAFLSGQLALDAVRAGHEINIYVGFGVNLQEKIVGFTQADIDRQQPRVLVMALGGFRNK